MSDRSEKICADADSAPIPIDRSNIGWWARRTLAEDIAGRERQTRRLGARRVFASIQPRLRRPIFVIGAPRSGTTFLGGCIGALPSVSYHFEPVLIKAAARYVHGGGWDEAAARRFYCTVYRWLLRIHADGDLRLVDKTPQNCFSLPFLSALFPDAQFVHIVRDGRDASLSYSKRPWLQEASAGSGRREHGGYPIGPYARFWVEPERVVEFESTSDLHRCAWAWRRFTEAALVGSELLAPDRYLEVRYEDVVGDPKESAARLVEFLGVPERQATGFNAAFAQAHSYSVGAWRSELSTAMLAEVEGEAGSLLARLDYS